jgi:hypothetical protein
VVCTEFILVDRFAITFPSSEYFVALKSKALLLSKPEGGDSMTDTNNDSGIDMSADKNNEKSTTPELKGEDSERMMNEDLNEGNLSADIQNVSGQTRNDAEASTQQNNLDKGPSW